MDTGQREFYSSMWDYVIHITEVLFLIQVKILEYVGKKICTQFGMKLNSKSPMNASPVSYPKITIPHKNECTCVLKTGLCMYSRTYIGQQSSVRYF